MLNREVKTLTRKKPSERKEEIREAGIKVIAEEGFHDATTDSIAEVAGVSVGTIYNYFNNKEEILHYIFEVEREKITDFFTGLTASGLPAEEKIRRFLKRYLGRALKNRRKSKLLLDEEHRPVKKVSMEILDYSMLLKSCVKELLEAGISEGSIKGELDPELVSGMIIGAADSVVVKSSFTDDCPDDVLEGASEEIVETLKRGIFNCEN